jgi:lipopolysaccharide transport system ATP-binding protein
VYMNGAVLGVSKDEIDRRFGDIAEFADIGEFIDQPVKMYSSGMVVRLAFAVIAHVDADILVVDEALAVGDALFTQKCMRFLREFMKEGTILFVSHDAGAVVNLCTKAIMLSAGEVVTTGAPKKVMEHYMTTLYGVSQDVDGIHETDPMIDDHTGKSPDDYHDVRREMINSSNLRNDIEIFKFVQDKDGFGVGGGKITSVKLRDHAGTALSWIVGGEDVTLEIQCVVGQKIFCPIIGFQFKDRLGQIIFADNTFLSYQLDSKPVEARGRLVAKFEFRLPVLPAGDYSVTVALADGSQDRHVQHHWMHDALILRVHASSVCQGLIGVPMKKIQLSSLGEIHGE